MYELKVLDNFAAAHQLSFVTEKCENLHGHNWKVEICIRGKKLNESGILIDFGIVKKHLTKIIKSLDHQFLNNLQLENFNKNNPSSENIALYIAEQMEKNFNKNEIKVSKVSIWESENSCATYFPEQD